MAIAFASGMATSGTARAQTTTGTTASGGATVGLTAGAIVTHTLPNGSDFTRGAALNPQGINFEDCERDVVLNFPITVSGASPGTDVLQAYAGTNCDTLTNRQPGVAGSTCWPIINGAIGYNVNAGFTLPIRARQILSQESLSVKEGFSTASSTDDSICFIQETSAPISLSVYFIFTDTTGSATNGVGTASIGADLAAAIYPPGLEVGIGDTLLLPTWTTVNDTDITGFNVYYALASTPAPVVPYQVCPDAATSTTSTDGASGDDGDDDADLDSATTAVTDAAEIVTDASNDAGTDAGIDAGTTSGTATAQGCYTVTPINATPVADTGSNTPYYEYGYNCTSPFPSGRNAGSVGDAGDDSGVEAVTTVADTDGSTSTGDDSGSEVTSTAGSISPLELQPREVDTSKYQFISVASNTSVSATLQTLGDGGPLVDGVPYAVAVAATDAYGNVGALTSTVGHAICQYPQPLTDFFESYQDDGGKAGGGFCSLEDESFPTGAGSSALLTGAAIVFAIRRRRR